MLYYVPTKNFTQKTLDAQLDAGTTSAMTLNNVTGVQNKPGVVLLNRVNSSGTEQPAADREFVSYTGVSGSTLTGLTRNADSGSSDQDHAVGTVVEFIPDVLWAQGLTDHILTEHGTDGTHDATKVAMLAGTQTFTGNKTFSGTVTLPSGVALTSPSITGDVGLATGGNIQVNSADPYRTIVIPAGSMSPTTTAGCAAVVTVEAGTNDVDYKTLDFDTTTVESAFTLFQMPNNWDGGTITFKPVWTAASGSGTVCFGLKGHSFADDDAIDQAYGTEQTSTDTLITAGDVHIGPESSAITLAGSPAGGQLVQLKVTRQTGSDTLGVDARLIGIRILYKIGTYSD